jgi:hypothetical protein
MKKSPSGVRKGTPHASGPRFLISRNRWFRRNWHLPMGGLPRRQRACPSVALDKNAAIRLSVLNAVSLSDSVCLSFMILYHLALANVKIFFGAEVSVPAALFFVTPGGSVERNTSDSRGRWATSRFFRVRSATERECRERAKSLVIERKRPSRRHGLRPCSRR